jgi:hypothetical protein
MTTALTNHAWWNAQKTQQSLSENGGPIWGETDSFVMEGSLTHQSHTYANNQPILADL